MAVNGWWRGFGSAVLAVAVGAAGLAFAVSSPASGQVVDSSSSFSPEVGRGGGPGSVAPGVPLEPQTGIPFDVVDPVTGKVARPDLVADAVALVDETPQRGDQGLPGVGPGVEGRGVGGVRVPAEVVGLATPTRRVVENADGTTTETVWLRPVRVRDDVSGEFGPVDLRLEPAAGGGVGPAAAVVASRINDVAVVDAGGRSWLAEVELDGEVLELGVEAQLSAGVVAVRPGDRARGGDGAVGVGVRGDVRREAGSPSTRGDARSVVGGDLGVVDNEVSIRFDSAGASFDAVHVEPDLSGLKLNYEVADRVSAGVPIRETLRLPVGWSARQLGEVIELVNASGVVVGIWHGGSMIDAAHVEVPGEMGFVGMELIDVVDQVATARLTLQQDWLDAADRDWPIFIDPSLWEWDWSYYPTDTYVWEGQASPQYANPKLWVGRWTIANGSCCGDGWMRSLVKFNWGNAGSGVEVVDATFSMWHAQTEVPNNPAASCVGSDVTVRRVTQWWDPLNVVYSTKPATTTAGEATAYLPGRHESQTGSGCVGAGTQDWDITDIAKSWASSGGDYGLYVYSMAWNEAETKSFRSFEGANGYAGEVPFFQVKYYRYRATFAPAGSAGVEPMATPGTPTGLGESTVRISTSQTNIGSQWNAGSVCGAVEMRPVGGGTALHVKDSSVCTPQPIVTGQGWNAWADISDSAIPAGVYDVHPDLYISGYGEYFGRDYGNAVGSPIRLRWSEPPSPVAPLGQVLANEDYTMVATNPHVGQAGAWLPTEYEFVVVGPGATECSPSSPQHIVTITTERGVDPNPEQAVLASSYFDGVEAFRWCVRGYDPSVHAHYAWTRYSAAQPVTLFQPQFMTSAGYPAYGANVNGVNTAIGNYVRSWVDASVPTVGPALEIVRTINTYDDRVGPFGPGVQFNYDISVTAESTGATVVLPDGRHESHLAPTGGSTVFGPPAGITSELRNASGGYEYETADSTVYTFNASGVLQTITDRDGQTLTFGYTNGDLTTITDDLSARSITLGWDGSRVNEITVGVSGTAEYASWTYFYDTTVTPSTLQKACNPRSTVGDEHCWVYDFADGRLHTITNPEAAAASPEVELAYDSQTGQVIWLKTADDLANGTTRTDYTWTQDPATFHITATATQPAPRRPGRRAGYDPDVQREVPADR